TLRALAPTGLTRIAKVFRIEVDPEKRIDAAAQVARALAVRPELTEVHGVDARSTALLRQLALANGILAGLASTATIEKLLQRALVFRDARTASLILPAAYVLQLHTWDGEEPRGVRAILARADRQALLPLAQYYLGRPPVGPAVLALETAFGALV